jgi:hypothetical protein
MHDRNKQVIVHFCGTFVVVVIIASVMHAIEYDAELQGANEYEAATNEVTAFMDTASTAYSEYCGSGTNPTDCAPDSTKLSNAKAKWNDQALGSIKTQTGVDILALKYSKDMCINMKCHPATIDASTCTTENKCTYTAAAGGNAATCEPDGTCAAVDGSDGGAVDATTCADPCTLLKVGDNACAASGGSTTVGCFTIIDPDMKSLILQVAGLEDWDDAYGGGGYWDVPDGKQPYEGSMKEDTYDWNLPSAVFFAMTIVSTIGYGTFSCSTALGQMFTMGYAIASISYFGYFLTITSDRILFFIKWASKKYKGHHYRIKPLAQLKIVGVLTLLFLIFLSAGGPVFAGWRYSDSVYFAIITFTTIGLGDFAPEFDVKSGNVIRSAGYFAYAIATLIGLALLSAVIGGITDVFQNVRITVLGLGGRRRMRLAREAKEALLAAEEKEMKETS